MGKSMVFNKRWLILLMCGLSLIILPTRAQTDYPPVLNPADFLADGVELIETLPIFITAYPTHTMYYFDPAKSTWSAYPNPSENTTIGSYEILPRTDGTYLFEDFPRTRFLDGVWIFNPVAEQFSHPEMACGVLQDLSGESEWIPYQPEANGEYYLCNTETGELGEILPISQDEHACLQAIGDDPMFFTSPDGQWVLFSICKESQIMFYGYEVTTKRISHLGTTSYFGEQIKAEWFTNTRIVIHLDQYQGNPDRYTLFVADSNQLDSLVEVFSQRYQPLVYRDNPPSYEFVELEYGARGGPVPESELEAHLNQTCGLQVYNLETRQKVTYPYIEGVCETGIVIPDDTGDRLARSLNYDQNSKIPSATLIRFNPETGSREELWTGEIQWIDKISPDGRYVLLAVVDAERVLPYVGLIESELGSDAPQLALFDLQVEEIIHTRQVERQTVSSFELPVYWLSENTFFIHNWEDPYFLYMGGNIVQIRDGKLNETEIITDGWFSPDNSRVPIRTDDLQKIEILDIFSGETTPLIKSLDTYNTFGIQWRDNEHIVITVIERKGEEFIIRGRWLVRVPKTN
jgi:hypothetical protein